MLSVLVWSMAVRLELRVRGCELHQFYVESQGVDPAQPSARSESGADTLCSGQTPVPPLSRGFVQGSRPVPLFAEVRLLTMTSAI